MKPELTPSEAVSIMQDAGSTLSLESFKRCLRQDKIPGGLYAVSEGQGQSAIYKVFALRNGGVWAEMKAVVYLFGFVFSVVFVVAYYFLGGSK